MRFLVAITLLALALAMAQPVAAQSFKPDYDAGLDAYSRGDYATALRHWQPLAKQGDARAQVSLGTMYSFGWGVTQNHAEAVRWVRMSAEQGNPKAQSSLAAAYAKGWGVSQDYKEAVRWWRKAALGGDPGGQGALGMAY